MDSIELETVGFTEKEFEVIVGLPVGTLTALRSQKKIFSDVPYHESGKDFTFTNIYQLYNYYHREPDVHPQSSTAREIPNDWIERAENILATTVGRARAAAMRLQYDAAIRKLIADGTIRQLG